MRRRTFITLLGGTAAWPLAARAQQRERVRRIGVLRSADVGDPKGKAQLFAFTEELAALGWADGPNLRMEIRWGGGNVNRASVFAKELVALQPDVILAQGTPVTTALKGETRTIPIVFATVLAKRRAETYDCVETCWGIESWTFSAASETIGSSLPLQRCLSLRQRAAVLPKTS
jgi:ABC-type uncharacterized transport system substrate-binding protein